MRAIDAWLITVSLAGITAAAAAGSWCGWSGRATEGQLTFVGPVWRTIACGTTCRERLRFNWAAAATVFAPFTLTVAFAVAGRRTLRSGSRSPARRTASARTAALAGDLAGWVVAAAVFGVVGGIASSHGNWNNLSDRSVNVLSGRPDFRANFNWLWASAAAMFAVLAAAIVRSAGADVAPSGSTSTGSAPDLQRAGGPSEGTGRAWRQTQRTRMAVTAVVGIAGVTGAYWAARVAGSLGADFGTSGAAQSPHPVISPSGSAFFVPGSRTNWFVFAPLAAGSIGAMTIRLTTLWASPWTGTRSTVVHRLRVAAAGVAGGGVALASVLAWRIRLGTDSFFHWSADRAGEWQGIRLNLPLFGLVAGPALVTAAAIALLAHQSSPLADRAPVRRVLAWLVLPAMGIVSAVGLGRVVGASPIRVYEPSIVVAADPPIEVATGYRMAGYADRDEGDPGFNWFVLGAVSGPFVAVIGAIAAAAFLSSASSGRRTRGGTART